MVTLDEAAPLLAVVIATAVTWGFARRPRTALDLGVDEFVRTGGVARAHLFGRGGRAALAAFLASRGLNLGRRRDSWRAALERLRSRHGIVLAPTPDDEPRPAEAGPVVAVDLFLSEGVRLDDPRASCTLGEFKAALKAFAAARGLRVGRHAQVNPWLARHGVVRRTVGGGGDRDVLYGVTL